MYCEYSQTNMDPKTDPDDAVYENEYIESLSEYERVIYDMAKKHLASSFELEKSIGYIAYCKTKDDKKDDKPEKREDK